MRKIKKIYSPASYIVRNNLNDYVFKDEYYLDNNYIYFYTRWIDNKKFGIEFNLSY